MVKYYKDISADSGVSYWIVVVITFTQHYFHKIHKLFNVRVSKNVDLLKKQRKFVGLTTTKFGNLSYVINR